MYEQRVNNIDKAQAQTLYKLSRVLGCDIEDLLENPIQLNYYGIDEKNIRRAINDLFHLNYAIT